jgi:hypothetical protein
MDFACYLAGLFDPLGFIFGFIMLLSFIYGFCQLFGWALVVKALMSLNQLRLGIKCLYIRVFFYYGGMKKTAMKFPAMTARGLCDAALIQGMMPRNKCDT